MARQTYTPERHALAFRVWRESHQNESETLRRLRKEYDWPLSRQTLYDWRDEESWIARATALEAEEARTKRAQMLDRAGILADLTLQKERYESYFADLSAKTPPEVDTKATQAYSNLARVILQIKSQMEDGAGLDKLALALEVMRHLGDFVRDDHPEHAQALLEVLEPFGERLADLYG